MTAFLLDSSARKRAASVTVSTVPTQGAGRGSSPTAALQSIIVQPIPFVAAQKLVERHHYLHSNLSFT